MREADKQALTAVWAVDGVGVATYRKLAAELERVGASWVDFWGEWKGFLAKMGVSEKTRDSCKNFESEHTFAQFSELLASKDITIIGEWEEQYPALLCEVDSRPPVLFARGNCAVQMSCPVAVVGTRRITSYGELATEKIVKELVLGGVTVVSGFMYGVDSAAHRCAVRAQGATVGVLGYGFDHLYPRTQRRLFEEVLASGGLFVTEFAPHIPPSPGNFPARNRLVAGMSLGVVVVEAAAESGSHITARLAADEGRDVFAVPGPITSPYSEGTKNLLNDGARLVTSGWEVLQEVQGNSTESKNLFQDQEKFPEKNSLRDKIMREISLSPCSIENLAAQIHEPIQHIQQEITLLELENKVSSHGRVVMVR